MQMIEKNIFRPLPNVKKSNLNFAETGVEQDEEMDDGTDYASNYFDNGEAFEDGEDDNLEDGDVY